VVEVQVTVHDEPDGGWIEAGVLKRLADVAHVWTVGINRGPNHSGPGPGPAIEEHETLLVVDGVAHRDAALPAEGMPGWVRERGEEQWNDGSIRHVRSVANHQLDTKRSSGAADYLR
jgi:hypothetical protein